jgi:hypothetical protein
MGWQPIARPLRPQVMNRMAVLVVVACLAVAGCESLAAPDRLVADLQVMRISSEVGRSFDDPILGGAGTQVCVGDETVTVYEFADVDAAIDAANSIDRDDPSMIGNGIVEWIGPPRFWLRDRALILYLGGRQDVDAALRAILGQPFAESPAPGRGPANRAPCGRG